MIWIVGVASILLNTLCVVGASMGLLVGSVFFLVGFGGRKRTSQSLMKSVFSKDGLMIMGTLTVVLVLLLLSCWNLSLTGSLLFPGMVGGLAAYVISPGQLRISGVLQGIWTILSLYWLLPHVFGFKSLGWKLQIIALGAAGCSIVYGMLYFA